MISSYIAWQYFIHLLFTQFLFCFNVVNQAIFLSRCRERLLVQEPKLGSVKSFDDDMACCVEISLNIQTFSSSSPLKTWRQIERGEIWVSVKPKQCTSRERGLGHYFSCAGGSFTGLLSLIGVTKCEQGSTFFRVSFQLHLTRCSQFPSNLWHGMCTSMLIAI